jgi:hypothetical protein
MSNQRERILAFLEYRGELGATNLELNDIAFRYGGRLFELRADGYRIRSSHVKGPVWRFTLLKDEPLVLAAEIDDPQYMDFLELLRPSNCCGEIVIDGMCGGCHEHV